MIAVGTICYLGKASPFAMSTYDKYKNKGYPLKCPCQIRSIDRLVVTSIVSNRLAICTYVDNKSIMAILPIVDLHRV